MHDRSKTPKCNLALRHTVHLSEHLQGLCNDFSNTRPCFNGVVRATNSTLKVTLYKCLKLTHTPHICTLWLYTNTHHVRSCTQDMFTYRHIKEENTSIVCNSSHEQKPVTSLAHPWSLLPFLLRIILLYSIPPLESGRPLTIQGNLHSQYSAASYNCYYVSMNGTNHTPNSEQSISDHH